MCTTAGCGIFFKDNVSPRDFKCPCGYTYWDIFQDFFLEPHQRKTNATGRAIAMEDKEVKIRQANPGLEFEAGLRAQFALHCIRCGLKARLEGSSKIIGFDDDSLPRVLAEIYEMSQGDLGSRGRSAAVLTGQPSLPLRSRAGTAPELQSHRLDSQSSRLSDSSSEPRASHAPAASHRVGALKRDVEPNLRPKPSQDTKSPARPRKTSITDQPVARTPDVQHRSQGGHNYGYDNANIQDDLEDDDDEEDDDDFTKDQGKQEPIPHRLSARQPDTSENADQRPPIRLPTGRIRYEILDHHRKRGTFGKWESIRIESIVDSKGDERDIFVIEVGRGAKQLGKEDIQRIIRDSELLDKAER